MITGASGHLGSDTIDYLLKSVSSERLVAFVRSEAKGARYRDLGIEVRTGDFNDTASLEKSVREIDKLLLVSGLDPDRLQQHRNVADAAKNAGVKHIVYTGVALRDPGTSGNKALMDDHFLTEDYIRESGLTYTFLRNTLYADAVMLFAGENALETGIRLPVGNGKVPFVLRNDLAEATANVLLQEGHENRIYELTGNEQYSYEEIAGLLSGLSGKAVPYQHVEPEEYADLLEQSGLPAPVAGILTGFTTDIRNHQFEIVTDELERLLGRKPVAFRDALKMLPGLS